MHLGLIVYEGCDRVSGGYLFDRMLVEHFRKSGDTVEVISLPRRTYVRNIADNFSADLKNKLLRSKFDVLLQDELTHPSFFLLNREIRRRAAYPVVSIVHQLRCRGAGSVFRTLLSRDIEKRYVRSVDGFIFPGRHAQGCVRELLPGTFPDVVAHPGRDRFPSFASAQLIRGRVSRLDIFKILFVGNIIPRKGLHVLLAALARITDVPWHLEIIGDEACDRKYAAALVRRIRAARLERQVRFRGAMTDTALIDLFKDSHVLAMPSQHEGVGIACLDALGFGVPVIASRSGGAGEIIAHGREGFLLAPGDTGRLTRYLRFLADDRRMLLDMSLNALSRHQTFPTWFDTGSAVRGFLAAFTGHRRLSLEEHRHGIFARPRARQAVVH